MKKKSFIVIVILLIAIILGLCAYIAYDKNFFGIKGETKKESSNTVEKKEDTNKINEEEVKNSKDDSALIDNSENLDFDFNELLNTLKNSVQSENITIFISECKEKIISEGEPPETEIKNIEVSNNTIDTIIKKLKSAMSIDKDITYSWPYCPPKLVTYYVSVNSSDAQLVHKQKVFSLNYAQGNDMLLVGYNNKGYAFHFSSNEEINGFIESLK